MRAHTRARAKRGRALSGGTRRRIWPRLGGLSGLEVAGLGLLLVVMPVVFDPWGRSGLLAVKVLAASVALALLLVSLVWARALVVPWGRAAVAAGAALVLVTLSTVASPALERSFLGAPQRLSGLLMWLCFAVAFVVGLSLRRLRGEAAEAVVAGIGVVAVLAVGSLAVLEAAGVDWAFAKLEFEGRLRSSLGNPSVLASFALLVGPLCAAVAVSERRWRWPALLGCGLAGVALVGSQTRGALVAFGVTAVVFVLVRSSRRQRLWGIAAVAGVLAVTAVVGRWEQFGFGLRGRMAIWRVAVETIGDRPLLGAGPEMFLVEHAQRVSAETVRDWGGQGTTDRAHSGVLDFAVSSGVLGAVAYLAVLVSVGFVAVKAMSSPRPVAAALGAGVLAYAVQQQVFFPHPAVDVVFWLLAGVLAAAVGAGTRPVRSLVFAVVVAGVVAGSLANSWSAVRNDHDFERALTAKTFEAAYGHLADAADRRSFDDEPYILMGALLKDSDDIGLIARGEARIRRGEELNPGNQFVSLALAEVHLQGFRVSRDPMWAHRAAVGLDKLLVVQPNSPTAHLLRGEASYLLGDLESAEAHWQRAAWLSPDDDALLRRLGRRE